MNSELTKFFSPSRLAGYQSVGETFEQGFARYQWNIKLAESLIPALSYLEIGLRNGVDRAIAAAFGKDWLRNPPIRLQLNQFDLEKIDEQKRDIQKEKGWAATHDDLVAKLGFGFWSALFHKRYDPILWQQDGTLIAIFPNMQRALRSRKYIAPKLHMIRLIRNRTAHHEPIWNHAHPDVQVVHQACLELTHAMSLEAAQELSKIDRFSQVYVAGLATK